MKHKSNSCDAVCNPGHNFWGLFCPPDQPGRGGRGAAARRPCLLRPLHHGLHHVLLLPHLHRPLKGVELCGNFPGNKLLRSAPSNLWKSFSKAHCIFSVPQNWKFCSIDQMCVSVCEGQNCQYKRIWMCSHCWFCPSQVQIKSGGLCLEEMMQSQKAHWKHHLPRMP